MADTMPKRYYSLDWTLAIHLLLVAKSRRIVGPYTDPRTVVY